jgi:hypothetical protein
MLSHKLGVSGHDGRYATEKYVSKKVKIFMQMSHALVVLLSTVLTAGSCPITGLSISNAGLPERVI